jgi:phage shock protein PspC (stress-responsive transcriptional regulator)
MALSDELTKLTDLHQRGALSDEEFARAKARLIDGQAAAQDAPAASQAVAAINALRRSRAERWIAGVCGGIAHATGVEPWVWRLLFALLTLCGGAGLLIYVLLWIFVPSDMD